MSARSWTAGHPFDAGMTVPVFDRCLETVSQAHPLRTPTLGAGALPLCPSGRSAFGRCPEWSMTSVAGHLQASVLARASYGEVVRSTLDTRSAVGDASVAEASSVSVIMGPGRQRRDVLAATEDEGIS